MVGQKSVATGSVEAIEAEESAAGGRLVGRSDGGRSAECRRCGEDEGARNNLILKVGGTGEKSLSDSYIGALLATENQPEPPLRANPRVRERGLGLRSRLVQSWASPGGMCLSRLPTYTAPSVTNPRETCSAADRGAQIKLGCRLEVMRPGTGTESSAQLSLPDRCAATSEPLRY